ncbi:unnamed protein product [Leptidea sinapis]|uniref:Outer dense fiber protein 3 n=1 Tax=Leptidea sinapis TaxID=189913 RepID=A0A5E4R4F0_9NEOP|nr:unnamed protein product [Leptidea sinapis]
MPFGYECRAKLVKQVPIAPTTPRGPVSGNAESPGPQYESPQIFCGKGYNKIKRAPEYTFGRNTPTNFQKPLLTPKAPVLDISGHSKKGRCRITHGVVSPRYDPVDKTKTPGPASYLPKTQLSYKTPPAYTIKPRAKPKYEPWDQWTPSPNMYLPPIPQKKPPAYTLGYAARNLKAQDFPGPGEHDPNFNYVRKSKPAFSFGAPFRTTKQPKLPAPNAYCEKKFMYIKRTTPAPSLGIRHSPYLGKQEEYLMDSKLNIAVSGTN